MDIIIRKINESYVKIDCDRGIAYELNEYFSFRPPGYQFMPSFKNKMWDGYLRLFNIRNSTLYYGLVSYVKTFCDERGYSVDIKDDIIIGDELSVVEAKDFISHLKLPFKERDYQLKTLIHAIRNKRTLVLSPTGCHKKGDKVLMSSGIWKNIEDIKVDEYVIGNDGKSKKVLRLYNGIDDLYKISPKNNRSSITVTKNHLLPLKFSDSKRKYGYCNGDKEYIENVCVDDYIAKSKYYKHCSNIFYNHNIISFDNEKIPDCNLSPYFIGVYLGDGHTYNCGVTNIDQEVIECVYSEAYKNRCDVVKRGVSYYITGCSNKRNIVLNEFDKIGLHFGSIKNRTSCGDKFIPHKLITTPAAYRLELLAGIIDTDGGLENNTNYCVSSKSEKLIKDIETLCISLGLATAITSRINKKYNKKYYYIRIMGDICKIPVRIARKKQIYNTSIKDKYRSSFNIDYVGKDTYYGIEVEDNLYITNGGMITHNSGKSLSIYLIVRYLQMRGLRGLLIVPTVSLVTQMYKDFEHYGYNSEKYCHMIYSGKEKDTNKFLTISTWQSLYKMPKKFFEKFDFVVGDESHLYKAKSLTTIMDSCINASYRIGTTGTLDGTQVHKLVLEGIFGPIMKATTTSELIDKGQLSKFSVKCLILKYPDEVCKNLKGSTYQEEMDFIVRNDARNNFIKNLTLSLERNTLVLFQYVEKHGKILYNILKGCGKEVFFIHGGTDIETRENVREITEKEKDAVIIASYGIFSTGVNIRNLYNVIFASPSKSRIRNLQSIGRVLRVGDDDAEAVLFDIADDLRYKNHTNYTLKGFSERIKIYDSEKFKYKFYNIKLDKG